MILNLLNWDNVSCQVTKPYKYVIIEKYISKYVYKCNDKIYDD